MPSSRGIFPTQGLNLHLLHWQAGSLPLSPQESPIGNSHFAMYLKPATLSINYTSKKKKIEKLKKKF